jgi:nitrogen regulatory protein P-II 1
MKEVKAYLHAHRIGAVIAELKASAVWAAVKGSLVPIDEHERHYSVELGGEVVNEYKLELVCEDAHVDEFVKIIRRVGRTGQRCAGWVYVTDLQQALPID